MSCPHIQHKRAPKNSPHHRPRPAPETLNPRAGRALPDALYDAHQNEERAGAAELRPPPDPPHPNVVRHGRTPQTHRAAGRLSEECTAGSCTKCDEGVSGELVPAEAPEVGDRGGRPGARRERKSVRSGLPQEHAAGESRDVVHRVDGRVHDDATTEREERRKRGARDGVEMWVKERVARRGVERRTGALHDVDGDVIHGQLENHLEA